MTADINKAIELLAKRITTSVNSSDALKYTQAALNLAHVLIVLDDIKKRGKI